MKNILLIPSFIFILVSISFAQKAETIKVKTAEYPDFVAKNQYQFPAYTRAKILFKNGDSGSARINFNYFRNIVKYMDPSGTALEITNPQDVAYLSTATDTIFSDNGYYHWVASSGAARLASATTFKLVSIATIGAFGLSSPAVDARGVSVIIGEGAWNFLQPNQEITISKVTTFYIGRINGNKNTFVPVNKKNLSKLFPKKDIENFMREKSINLNKVEDLVDLMVFISNG